MTDRYTPLDNTLLTLLHRACVSARRTNNSLSETIQLSRTRQEDLERLAAILTGIINGIELDDYAEFCRACLFEYIVKLEVSAFEAIIWGRMAVLEGLDDTFKDVLARASLLDDPSKNPKVLDWWNKLEVYMRLAESESAQERRLQSGRTGELIILRLEEVLAEADLGRPDPLYEAFEDNGLGYDIIAFRPRQGGFKKRYLEVKHDSGAHGIYITWGEIRKAQILKDAWILVYVSQHSKLARYFGGTVIDKLLPASDFAEVTWDTSFVPEDVLASQRSIEDHEISDIIKELPTGSLA